MVSALNAGRRHARLPLELERDGKAPVQRQLTNKLKEAILEHKLMPGQLLPSTRELAKMLGISRATAVRIYEDLGAQGLIETEEGTGTFVRRRPPARATSSAPSDLPFSELARRLLRLQTRQVTDFDSPGLKFGCAPPECLPVAQWKQALADCCRVYDPSLLDYGSDPFGYGPLREAICAYVSRSRMIDCPPESLVIMTSSTYPLTAVAELLVDSGDSIVFPEPGSLFARETFAWLGADLTAVAVDEQGMDVRQLTALRRPPKIVYVNSSHHDPTGAPLSMERRQLLLDWVDRNDVIIIEDDYDSEYRPAGSPLPPLRALTGRDNVIYISSFRRTLYPLVNVSYVIAPAQMVPALTGSWIMNADAFQTHFCFLDQLALTSLLNSGEYERHLRRTEAIYASRWRAMVHALSVSFGTAVSPARASSSSHLFVHLRLPINDAAIADCARAAGLPLLSAGMHFACEPPAGAFLLPALDLPEEEIVARVAAFKENVDDRIS